MVIFWTLYIFVERENTLKALKTIDNIDIKNGIAYFRILKKSFFEKLKNGKSKTWKSWKYFSEFSYFQVVDTGNDSRYNTIIGI